MLAIGTLLAVLGFLTGGATAVGTGDVLFLLGLGLHLALVRVLLIATAAEGDAVLKDILEIVVHGGVGWWVVGDGC